MVGHRFKTIAQTASQEKCKREFLRRSRKYATLYDRSIPSSFFYLFSEKKKSRNNSLNKERKERNDYIFDHSFEMKLKKKEGEKNTFTPIVGYGDNPRNLCLESEQASCNLTEAESCIDRHF